MRRFLTNILLFFLFVVLVDQVGGIYLDYCQKHPKGGQTRAFNDLCELDRHDVLIMGSSQANHHYDAVLMSDSLGLDVYNAGMDGNGIVLMSGIYKMIAERYTPQLIIYNITPSFDFYKYGGDDNNKRYITPLKPYYNHSEVRHMLDDVSSFESIKVLSGFYRYNSVFLNTIKNHYMAEGKSQLKGYEPVFGVMDYEPTLETDGGEIDPLKVKYLKEFIEEVQRHGTELIFVFSPRYGVSSSDTYNLVKQLCEERSIKYFDYYADPRFIHNKAYYEDPMHLNINGATLFTQQIINQIVNQ